MNNGVCLDEKTIELIGYLGATKKTYALPRRSVGTREQLVAWSERILTVKTVEEIFQS